MKLRPTSQTFLNSSTEHIDLFTDFYSYIEQFTYRNSETTMKYRLSRCLNVVEI